MQNTKHKHCSICNKRLDKLRNRDYSQVSKAELIEKLRTLNKDIKPDDYVCRKHSKQVELQLQLKSNSANQTESTSISMIFYTLQLHII